MGVSVTPLEAIDNGFSRVLDAAFSRMNADAKPDALKNFLNRASGDRMFQIDLGDVQTALKKIAYYQDEHGRVPDLPLVIFYRESGLTPDDEQPPQVREVVRFISDKTLMSLDDAMKITTLPITVTYSILFLGWDRPTIEALALAWWGYVVPARMSSRRFKIPYTIDGESFEVTAKINAPQESLTAPETLGDGRRLWGARTMVEIKTQVVYGEKVQILDYVKIFGTYDKLFR